MVVQCDTHYGEGGICLLKLSSLHTVYSEEAEHF